MRALVKNLLQRVNSFDWLALLITRLGVGIMFCGGGWGKVHDIAGLGDWFGTLSIFGVLGIPFPHFSAAMVAWIEFVGGACLVIGLGTRIFAFLLACTMVVALITVGVQSDAKTLGEWLFKSEMLMIWIFLWMMVTGSGKVGLDHWIARKYGVVD